MSLTKWASIAANNLRSIQEVKPDKPKADTVGGVPDQTQPANGGRLQDDDWFEEPAIPKGMPENGSNNKKTNPDDPTGTDRSFTKLNGSGISGSGTGHQLSSKNNYHG